MLVVSGASTADGAALSQWARHDGANQRFQFVDSGGGYYRLKAQHSGKVLDVYNFSGASLQQQLDSSERQVVWRPGFSPAVRVQGRP